MYRTKNLHTTFYLVYITKGVYMSNNNLKVSSLLIVLTCLLPISIYANEKSITISVGGAAAGGGTSSLLLAEYEHALTKNFALAGRIGYMKYNYSEEEYEEDGNGPGIQVSAKFYPGANALHGFYFGGGLGLWKMDGDSTDDKGTAWESQNNFSTQSAEIHAELGWRVGDKVQFAPSLQVGTFLSSEADLAQFFNINLGVSFLF